MKVLLAVADPALRALWEDVLADHGHQAFAAAPDRSAWPLIVEARPALAVVELGPGREEALDLCRRLRQPGYEPRPGLLVLVPADRPEEMVTALRAGADDVLGGPADRRSAVAHLAALERRHHPAPLLGRPAHELASRIDLRPSEPAPSPPSAPEVGSSGDGPPTAEAELAERLMRALAAAMPAATATPAEREVRSAFELARQLTRALRAPVPDPGAAPPCLPVPAPPSRPTVLLIDDEASVRYPLRMALQQCGYRVLEAADGAEGLDLLAARGEEIALVVVDQRMPKVSGAEVLRELRRRPRYVPAVLMSGQAAADLDPAGAGADAYLRKPFELADLARTVRRLVSAEAG